MADAGSANEAFACKVQRVIECMVSGGAAADNDLLNAGHGIERSRAYVSFLSPHRH